MTARRAGEVREIEREFSGWHVWVSSIGRYWAVRQGPDACFSRDDPRPMTVDADDAAGLATLLGQVSAAGNGNLTPLGGPASG